MSRARNLAIRNDEKKKSSLEVSMTERMNIYENFNIAVEYAHSHKTVPDTSP
jgi:hypothetical protein